MDIKEMSDAQYKEYRKLIEALREFEVHQDYLIMTLDMFTRRGGNYSIKESIKKLNSRHELYLKRLNNLSFVLSPRLIKHIDKIYAGKQSYYDNYASLIYL